MLIIGTILLALGTFFAIKGFGLNSSLSAQLESIMEDGSKDPGTIFIIIGFILFALGIAVIVFSIIKKKHFKLF